MTDLRQQAGLAIGHAVKHTCSARDYVAQESWALARIDVAGAMAHLSVAMVLLGANDELRALADELRALSELADGDACQA